ncbi:MAG: cupin domain-containing protein [Variibacter sp.]|nr:cupin domain-containing protein [Variibacter sp.]
MVLAGNVFRPIPAESIGETVELLASAPTVRIERIISHGEASPPGYWYDQPWAEWVIVLSGAARLRFEDEPQERPLGPGDYLLIPAHRRHRVEWTDPGAPTLWLAVHYAEAPK